ncbi:sensor histidine kinase [Cohnella suwonensis]|uniref:histidine kinase n=1 Tax=Cohnella suwonensis TaxID=696072 RepID=A0ABW0LPA9_9BACL
MRSLRSQLLARLLLILACLFIVVGLIQFAFMEKFLYQNRASAVQRQIQSVPGEMWERFRPYMRRGPQDSILFFPSASVAFINLEGEFNVLSPPGEASTVTVPHLDQERYEEAMRLPRQSKATYRIVNEPGLGEQLVVLQAVRTINGIKGVVQVNMSTKPLKTELYRQLLLFAGLALAAIVGGLLTFLPVIRRTLTPLSRMIDTVERIDSGKLSERLPEPGTPLEIDRLSHSFNRMLERLEGSFQAEQEAKEQMRRFVADASHELRTPLTSIHGFLEVLLRGAATEPEQLNRALNSMHGESERIIKLVNDLLQLAKLDRESELRAEPYDLAELVRKTEPQLRILAGQRGIELDLAEPAVVPLDRDKVKQVLLNLFHNAVQHTDPQEGRIRIAVRGTDAGAALEVEDNGCGIAEEHLPHLFERFYRVDSSRTRKHGGAGLGLSISRSIVELHGGSVTATSRPGEGSLLVVEFPSMLVEPKIT